MNSKELQTALQNVLHDATGNIDGNNVYIVYVNDNDGAQSAIVRADSLKMAYAAAKTVCRGASVKVVQSYIDDAGTIDGDALIQCARQITKVTAKNAVLREGTQGQMEIDKKARCGDWTFSHLADMVSEVEIALSLSVSGKQTAEKMQAAAEILSCTVQQLHDISLADRFARVAIVNLAEKNLYNIGKMFVRYLSEDEHNCRRNAKMLRMYAESAFELCKGNKSEALQKAVDAAYNTLNTYLTNQRAIRVQASPDCLSLDALDADATNDPRQYDDEAIDCNEAETRQLLKSALGEVMEYLTARQLAIYKLLYKGYSVNQISAKLHIQHKTTYEHVKKIATIVRDVLAKQAPGHNATQSANIAVITAEIGVADATARTEAKKAELQAVEAANAEREATRKKSEKSANELEKLRKEAVEKVTTAEKMQALLQAVESAQKAMTPALISVYHAFNRGLGTKAVAKTLNKSTGTITKQKKVIRDRIIEELHNTNPNFAADINGIDLSDLLGFIKK